MSDNTTGAAVSGGDVIRTIDRGAAKTQVVGIDAGGEAGPESLVTASNPLPVVDAALAAGLGATQSTDAPQFVSVAGDPNGDFAGLNLLEEVIKDNSGLALSVRQVNPPKSDTGGALIESDAVPFPIAGAIGTQLIIDTTGYDSLAITTQALAGNVTTSNDQITWSALTGTPLVLGAYVTAIAANLGYSFPCIGRFIRIVPTTAGSASVYLRSATWNASYTTTVPTLTAQNNIAQLAGSAPVTAGVAGTLAVGGNIAAGVAPTANPLLVAGIDTGGLTRRVLTDTSGRVYVLDVGLDAQGVQRQLGMVPSGSDGVPQLVTKDTSNAEGQTVAELMLQTLREMKIMNYYLSQLPIALWQGISDDPSALRADDSFLNS